MLAKHIDAGANTEKPFNLKLLLYDRPTHLSITKWRAELALRAWMVRYLTPNPNPFFIYLSHTIDIFLLI